MRHSHKLLCGLPFWQHRRNVLITPVRDLVEHVSRTLKRSYAYWTGRYLGLARIKLELCFKCLAYNLRRAAWWLRQVPCASAMAGPLGHARRFSAPWLRRQPTASDWRGSHSLGGTCRRFAKVSDWCERAEVRSSSLAVGWSSRRQRTPSMRCDMKFSEQELSSRMLTAHGTRLWEGRARATVDLGGA